MLAIKVLFVNRTMPPTNKNQLSYYNQRKCSFYCLYKFYAVNHISFLIHTLGILLKHVADKNKTFPIVLNLASYILIQVNCYQFISKSYSSIYFLKNTTNGNTLTYIRIFQIVLNVLVGGLKRTALPVNSRKDSRT